MFVDINIRFEEYGIISVFLTCSRPVTKTIKKFIRK